MGRPIAELQAELNLPLPLSLPLPLPLPLAQALTLTPNPYPYPSPLTLLQAELLCTALGPSSDACDLDGDESPTPTPHLWISAITLGASQRLPRLTDQERIALDDLLVTVAADLAKCEKLISTPIPLGYTRSSVRFLWIWITLLPFALSRTFTDFATDTWWADKPLAELPVLLTTMTFISFIFLSIEDIAVQIEEPFAILPLEVQHKWLLRDAEQTRWLMRRAARTPSPYDPVAPAPPAPPPPPPTPPAPPAPPAPAPGVTMSAASPPAATVTASAAAAATPATAAPGGKRSRMRRLLRRLSGRPLDQQP